MKALITGSEGFVGKYLRAELEAHGYTVTGLDLQPGDKTVCADLLNPKELEEALKKAAPDAVFHLAGQANVAKSWKIPQRTFELNVLGAVNLMEAVRGWNPKTRMVIVGSSDQYGSLGEAGENVSETTEMKPQSPYAVSKKAQEEIAQVYANAYGMNICMTRSFNHAGTGQREGFMIPDFAAGIVRVERGLQSSVKVGNLSARRDFTHVRDVVRAYRLLAEKGHPGEVYNVGSGATYSAREVLDRLLSLSNCVVPVEQDPAKMRPSDTPVICCDHSKLTAHTGWQPELTLETMLRDVLRDWRDRLQKEGNTQC